jgi:hypothetical protein
MDNFISEDSLCKAHAVLNDTELTKAISVTASMQDKGADVDAKQAARAFSSFVDTAYSH